MLFIDGIATQKGMVKALEDRLRIKVTVPHDCEYVCANRRGAARTETSGRARRQL